MIPQTLSSQGEPWLVTLLVNKSPITLKIDTGADVTVIPDTEYDEKRDG